MTTSDSPRAPLVAGRGSREHLDRLEWPVTLSAMAYGVRIGVRMSDGDLAEDVTGLLPPGWERLEFADTGRVYSLVKEEDDESGVPCGSLYVDDSVVVERVTRARLLRAFESNVQLHVAEMAPERVFVHAGVVGYRGRALVFPGRSFTGKTTLVAALVQAGADYFSDEYAVIDAAGTVHPYPRPLAIRNKGVPGITKCPVDTLGGRAGTDPLPVGLVIVCKFRAGSQWKPEPMSQGHGIQALFANTVAARRIPETVMAILHQVVATSAVVTSDRGEAETVVRQILHLALGLTVARKN